MKFSKSILLGLVVAALAYSAQANAATYLWTFTDTNSVQVASGQLTTDAAAYVNGEVISISGTVFGDAITGLVDNPIKPATATSADGLWYYDNNLSFPAPYVTNPGLLFNVGSQSVSAYNLFSDSPGQYELWADLNGSYGNDTFGTFSVAAVPEPAIWAMMLLGFGFVGFSLRASRRAAPRALVA